VRDLDRTDLVPPPADPPRPAPPRASGLRRALYLTAGLACIGLAYLGVLLPGLPTTPWVLLASWCFARSSPMLQRWLRRSPVFGKLLRDWDEHRGIRRPVKLVAVCLVLAALSFSIGYAAVPVWVKWVIGCCGLVGIGVLLFVVPTIRER
jgi:uncharacterized membrane protein YbaN (DUF454 family)